MDSSTLSLEARQKFDELVAILAAEEYGPDGPPEDATFAEIELIGHRAGRMSGRAVHERLTAMAWPTTGPSSKLTFPRSRLSSISFTWWSTFARQFATCETIRKNSGSFSNSPGQDLGSRTKGDRA